MYRHTNIHTIKIQICRHTFIHKYRHADIHLYIETDRHTYIHTCIHTCVSVCMLIWEVGDYLVILVCFFVVVLLYYYYSKITLCVFLWGWVVYVCVCVCTCVYVCVLWVSLVVYMILQYLVPRITDMLQCEYRLVTPGVFVAVLYRSVCSSNQVYVHF